MTVAEVAVKTATSVIPVGGELISCIIDEVKSQSLQKRQNEWLEQLEKRFEKIETDIQSLGDNEIFATAIIKATELAIKTAENKKREYLANAVLNSIDFEAEESMLMIYMNLLEQYTVWHLQVLSHYHNPSSVMRKDSNSLGGVEDPLYQRYPQMKQNKEFVDKIIVDLQNDGVLAQGNWAKSTMTASGMYAKRTTSFGDGFLEFILDTKC